MALSTAEAETIVGIEAVKQIMHLRLFLKELGQEQRKPSVVWEGNMAAISLGHGIEQSKRSKHYALKVAFRVSEDCVQARDRRRSDQYSTATRLFQIRDWIGQGIYDP